MQKRIVLAPLLEDIKQKMVLLAGPRQCGKTTLAEAALKHTGSGAYYSWDMDAHRRLLLASKMDPHAKLWVFDELHKYKRWRNWLKGAYDLNRTQHQILVTGSAKLDAYSRGGDSLQGRYFFHRLHPFTFAELNGLQPLEECETAPTLPRSKSKFKTDALELLFERGGFPEPLFSKSTRQSDRWRTGYRSRLVREEIDSLEDLKDLDRVELLYDRLPVTVGSVLSINSLREDLEVSFETIRNWLTIFERTYAVFRIPPFGAAKIKAVKKEQKLYLWDWGHVEAEGARFENLVALHLLRFTHWMEDIEGKRMELRYFRDVYGREVDFLLLKNQKPWIAIEAKLDDRPLDSNLKYFLERVQVPYAFQISMRGKENWAPAPIQGCQIRVLPAAEFLAQIP